MWLLPVLHSEYSPDHCCARFSIDADFCVNCCVCCRQLAAHLPTPRYMSRTCVMQTDWLLCIYVFHVFRFETLNLNQGLNSKKHPQDLTRLSAVLSWAFSVQNYSGSGLMTEKGEV